MQKSKYAGITHEVWLHMQTYFQWGPGQINLQFGCIICAKEQKEKDKANICNKIIIIKNFWNVKINSK